MIDSKTLATQGYLNSARSIALQGAYYKESVPGKFTLLSVLIQGILFGPQHTALQGFVIVPESKPRTRVPAKMPAYMKRGTQFVFKGTLR